MELFLLVYDFGISSSLKREVVFLEGSLGYHLVYRVHTLTVPSPSSRNLGYAVFAVFPLGLQIGQSRSYTHIYTYIYTYKRPHSQEVQVPK